MPLMWAICPITAVIAIPIQPPKITRTVGTSTFEPAIFALTIPVITRPAIVKMTMLKALAPRLGANAPKNGMHPPNVKLAADARAA
jgi:hypothetical protein